MLDVLDNIDEDILERNTQKRCKLWAKVTAQATHSGTGKRKNVAIIALAATLALTLAAFAAFVILSLGNDPTLPPIGGTEEESQGAPSPTEGISSIEKTATDGNKSTYTITYGDGKTATLDITDKAPDGSGAKVTGVTFDEASNVYLTLATGKLLNMGQAVGTTANASLRRGHNYMTLSSPNVVPLDTATPDATTVAGVTVDEQENMSYRLSNDQNVSLGKVHKRAEGDETSMSMACINEAGELVLGFASGETMNLGRVTGKDGKDGVGIAGISLTDAGELSVTLTNGTILNLGNIKGQDGIGIAESKINDEGELVLTYTDGNSVNLGRVVGERGEDGVGIGSININGSGELTIILTDGTSLNLGNIKGQDGKSAYELYKDKFGYEGTEEEWLSDLVNGNLATKVRYPVTFDSAGGSDVPTQEIEEGGKVAEPEIPTRKGYTFKGWFLGEEAWSFAGYSITEPITLTAKWEIITYTVSFAQNHEQIPTSVTTYTVEDTFTLKDLSYFIDIEETNGNGFLVGHTFKGWTYGDVTTPEKNVSIPKGTVGDLTFTAHWDKDDPYQLSAPFKNTCLDVWDDWWHTSTYYVMHCSEIYAVCDGVIKTISQESDGSYTLTLAMTYDRSGKTAITYSGLSELSAGMVKDAQVSAGDVLGTSQVASAGLGTLVTVKNNLIQWFGGEENMPLYNFFPGGMAAWESAIFSTAINTEEVLFLVPKEGDWTSFTVAKYHSDYVTLKYDGGDPPDPWYTLAMFDLKGKQYCVIKYRTASECNGEVLFIDTNTTPYLAPMDWDNTGEWTHAFIDISNVDQVQEANQTWFRIDFFDSNCNAEDTFDLAYVAFFDSKEAADEFVATFG